MLYFNELIRPEILKKLIKCLGLRREDRSMLIRYQSLINENNEAVVKYEQKLDNLGRYFADRGLSLQTFSKKIRHTLVSGTHIDIDITNCHFVLLLQYCGRNNIECDTIKDYVDYREERLIELMKVFETDRTTVKELMISLLYLGKASDYAVKHGLQGEPNTYPEWLEKFEKEMKNISARFQQLNEVLFNKIKEQNVKGKDSYIATTMSYVLGDLENELILSAVNFLTKHNYKVDTLCFDGILIRKKDIPDTLLENLSTYCFEKVNYKVNFEIKPMELGLDIDKENKKNAYSIKQDNMDMVRVANTTWINEPEMKELPVYEKPTKEQHEEIAKITRYNNTLLFNTEYNNKAERFEEYNAKIMNPSSLLEVGEGSFRLVNYKDFRDHYNNIIMKMSGKTKIKFVNEWLEDINIRTYQRVDFLPYPRICEDYVFNTFTGLEAELKVSNNADVGWFKEHLNILCGKEEEATNYMLNYLAHMIQKPGELPRVACVFRSVEGVGKNSFFESFCNEVLGRKYKLQTAEPDDVIGRFNLNQNKLMIILDEAQGKDMFMNSEKIKNLITAEELKWESKGVNSVVLQNMGRYFFFSNNDNPVKISMTDRRFIMFECSAEKANDTTYFNDMVYKFKSQSREIYDMLMSIDITKWNPIRDRVQTAVYKEVQSATIPIISLFLQDLYYENNHNESMGNQLMIEIRANCFLKLYNKWLKEGGYKFEVTSTKFGRDVKCYEGVEKKRDKYGFTYQIDYETLYEYLKKMKYVDQDEDEDFVTVPSE